MPMSRRKRILKAIIKGKVRDAFFRNTYERLEDSAQRNSAAVDLDVARSRISSGSSQEFSRSRSSSGRGAKEFTRSRSSSGSSKYSSSGSSRRSRQAIAPDPRLLKRSDTIRPPEYSLSSSNSGSSKYSISSCSSRDLTRSRSRGNLSRSRSSSGSSKLAFAVAGLENRLLQRSDPIKIRRRDRLLKRTDSLVPKKFHVQLGVSSSSPPLTREDSFGGLNWSKPAPNMKLKHVDSLVIISAKLQPGCPVRTRDSDRAMAEVAKHRSFKRIDTLRSFKRVDPARALRRLESVRAMQPQQRRLKRSKNILRKSRLWKASRGVVHFHINLGRAGPKRPRDCYLRAMLKAAEDRAGDGPPAAAFDCKFGPIHVDEIEDEVGFCRNVMLFYHRSVSCVR